MWSSYFPSGQSQNFLGLGQLLDSTNDSEVARILAIDSYYSDLSQQSGFTPEIQRMLY